MNLKGHQRKRYTPQGRSPPHFPQKRFEISSEPGRLLSLKNTFEKGSPLLCFVAAYIALEHGREALKDWSDSSVRCTELLAQGSMIPALF